VAAIWSNEVFVKWADFWDSSNQRIKNARISMVVDPKELEKLQNFA